MALEPRERAAAYGQFYGMGTLKTARIVGQYPPRDYTEELAYELMTETQSPAQPLRLLKENDDHE